MCSQVKETYRNKTPGVFVILLEEYLKKFWSQIDGIEDLYQSLTFSLEESKNVGEVIFPSVSLAAMILFPFAKAIK